MERSYLRLTLLRAWRNAWNSRSAPGSLAQIAATLVAGVIVYFASTKSERTGILLAVVAAIAATLFVLLVIGVIHLVLAQRSLYRDMRAERDQAIALVTRLTTQPDLSSEIRIMEDPNSGGPLLRLALTNRGALPLPAGALLNVIFPAAWSTFEGCNSQGLFLLGAAPIPSDEPLPGDVPAKLWHNSTEQLIGGGVTLLFFFRVRGEPGRYDFIVRIAGLNETHTVELPAFDEKPRVAEPGDQVADLLGRIYDFGRMSRTDTFGDDLRATVWHQNLIAVVRAAYGDTEAALLTHQLPAEEDLPGVGREPWLNAHLAPLAAFIERTRSLEPRQEFKAEEWMEF
jgi:hypothetical protein